MATARIDISTHEPGVAEEAGALVDELAALRDDMLALERDSAEWMAGLRGDALVSARNLLHYVAMRRRDLRAVQPRLAALGLSSLGRGEAHVMANLDAVSGALRALAGLPHPQPAPAPGPIDLAGGGALLRARTERLLGPPAPGGRQHIMVTMPSEAASDPGLVRALVAGGMTCMRINCAHDGPGAWGAMIAHLRDTCSPERPCRVLMDLPGPKLRTGALEPGPCVAKWAPERDESGSVTAPARVWLTPSERPARPPQSADLTLPVPGELLASLRPGDRLIVTDAREKPRRLRIAARADGGLWAEARTTAYVRSGALVRRAGRRAGREFRLGDLPPVERPIVLCIGDELVLTRDAAPGHPARREPDGPVTAPATIPCTLPEVFADVRAGEPIWLDDGKIGGVIRAVGPEAIRVEITRTRPGGSKLRADKGINLPESPLRLPALTADDLEHLPFVARHADLVGLSFVHEPEDVRELQRQLAELGGERLGIVLKIETRRGFDRLPALLLAALRSPAAGVMIARGDLAVECGYERLAEVQEEILWLCEAAHMPVIWATQVLETLAKKGQPSRAEITDAAMGERAECVMLNKGPYIVRAVHVLDDILRRMAAHQSKKSARLRPLNLARGFGAGG